MSFDEGGDVRTNGNDAECVQAGVGEGGAHEVLGESASAELGRDEGVGEHDALAFERVVGVGEVAVEGEDEASVGLVVLDDGLRRRGHCVTNVQTPLAS